MCSSDLDGNSINALGLGVKAVGGAIAGVFKKKDD